jgi:signal transduction histidine kinase
LSLETFTRRLHSVDQLLERGESTENALEELMAIVNGLSEEYSIHLDPDGILPLKRGDRILGYLKLEGSPPPALLSLFQREATHLLERADRESRQQRELKRLSRAGRMVSSSLDLQSTLEAILQMALEVTGARYGIFRLLDESATELVTAAVVGENLDAPLVDALSAVGEHITGWVARHKTSIRIDDLRLPPWSESYVPLDYELEMRSELAVPLLGNGDRLEGVLNLESPSVGAFSHGDQLLLETFAGQAVTAIQQARLLDALQEMAAGVLEWPCDQVLERLVEIAMLLLNAEGVELDCSDRTLKRGSPLGTKVSAGLEARGHLAAYLQEPTQWEEKVLACLAHHAVLALKNERRLIALRESQQRQALTETFAAVGDLSANLLHQLNNKIGVIPVRVEGIMDKCGEEVAGSPYLQRNLSEIGNSAQRALEIVRQNLSILRPRASGLVNLSQCLKRAVKELELDNMVSAELNLPPVRGDVRSLALVFLNLLENAARAMDGKGRILVLGEQVEDKVVVRVTDNGPGIPPERHGDIFQLNSDRSKPHNLGFGLWWVRTVMERMGGQITLTSDRTGTTFFLEFPLP